MQRDVLGSVSRKMIMLFGYTGLCISTLFYGVAVPRYVSCYSDENCSMSSLNHLTILIILNGVTAFFFASNIPERMFPGKFHIIGQGHQIVHVLVTFTARQHFRAINFVIKLEHTVHRNPDLSYISFCAVSLVFTQVLTLYFKMRHILSVSNKLD